MPDSSRSPDGFTCPVPAHSGPCPLQKVAASDAADSVEAIGSAVVVHGHISIETFTDIRHSHAGRHVTLDGDVLVIWPSPQAEEPRNRTDDLRRTAGATTVTKVQP